MAHLLPGAQYLQDYGGGGSADFQVTPEGTVDYSDDPSLAGILSGQGTPMLTVIGRAVAINATALTTGPLVLNTYSQFGTAGPFTAPFTATVLPGTQYLQQGAYSLVTFTVGNDGTISIDNPLALSDTLEVQNGAVVPTLVVKGETIHIDARALSGVSSTFTIAGVGTFDTSTVQTLTLLPGWERFQAGAVTLDFQAELFDTVDYDPFLDAMVASGLGTDTLVLLPPM
jgi:hypothetical protein